MSAHDAQPEDPESGTAPHVPLPSGTWGQTPEEAAQSRDQSAPDSFPRYEILGELGRGGMGVVYRARQLGLNRDVAIKTISAADTTRTSVARFWAEAEVMAAVKHPHVVQVIELGEHDGRPFMAMEMLGGGSLADRLRGGPLPPREAAGLLEKVTRGVAAAHELGVVHRDLKPGNILLAEDGTPKVADFGLAKWGSADLTQTQALMGTPAYMAPEQAAGRAKFVGPPADVWALGVILYEAVSGGRPFAADSREALLSQIRSAEPNTLRSRSRGVPRDLETVVSKCLAKEPAHRYTTATELADDLGRFLRGEPIAARPVGRAERLVRWVRRKPAKAAAYGFSSLAAALALVAFVVFGFWREAEGATREAESARKQLAGEKKRTEAARDEAERLWGVAIDARRAEEVEKRKAEDLAGRLARYEYGRTVQAAYQLWKDGRLAEARARLAGTRPDLRGWEYDYVHRLCHADLVTLEGQRDRLTSAAWSPDGTKVVTTSLNDDARVWDATTGAVLLVIKSRPDRLKSASWSPDGSKLLARSWGETAQVLDAATGNTLAELRGHAGPITAASWSRDGAKVLTASRDKTGRVWDPTGRVLAELRGHSEEILSASWSPDGSKVVTFCNDRTARVWESATGKVLGVRKECAGAAHTAAWSPDGSKVVSITDYKAAHIWDTATGETLAELRTEAETVSFASWSPDGKRVFTNSMSTGPRGPGRPAEGGGRVWDPASGKPLAELRGHTGPITFAAWSSGGSRLLTIGRDGVVCVWDAAGKLTAELRGHSGEVTAAVWSPDGTRILTAGADATARVWDAAGGQSARAIAGAAGVVTSASWSPDGSRLLTIRPDRTARVLDAATGKTLATLAGHGEWVGTAEWSPDGSRALTASLDGTARVWDSATGATLVVLKGHARGVYAASWSPDGSKVATASEDDTARVWDAASGTPLAVLKVEGNPFEVPMTVHSAKWSPDGSRVLTTNWGVARVWDLAVPRVVSELAGRRKYPAKTPLNDKGGNPFQSASWSPDGSRVLVASHDTTAYVRDVETGRVLVEFEGHTGPVASASYSPGGRRVVTTAEDGTARVWDAESGAELLALPGFAFASFSPDGRRLVTLAPDRVTILVYDSRPVNRALVGPVEAPPPRPAQ